MNRKKITKLFPLFMVLVIFLSGCVQRTKSGKPYGWVYDNLAVPTQHLLMWLSQQLGNNLGWAIILITFIVRLILMPLMINQSRKSTIQQEKMASIQPYMTDIQKRSKEAKTQEEQMEANQEMMALYKDNNISMTGGIGCLPLLIQMPIFCCSVCCHSVFARIIQFLFLWDQFREQKFCFNCFNLYYLCGTRLYVLDRVRTSTEKTDAIHAHNQPDHDSRDHLYFSCRARTLLFCRWYLCLFTDIDHLVYASTDQKTDRSGS